MSALSLAQSVLNKYGNKGASAPVRRPSTSTGPASHVNPRGSMDSSDDLGISMSGSFMDAVKRTRTGQPSYNAGDSYDSDSFNSTHGHGTRLSVDFDDSYAVDAAAARGSIIDLTNSRKLSASLKAERDEWETELEQEFGGSTNSKPTPAISGSMSSSQRPGTAALSASTSARHAPPPTASSTRQAAQAQPAVEEFEIEFEEDLPPPKPAAVAASRAASSFSSTTAATSSMYSSSAQAAASAQSASSYSSLHRPTTSSSSSRAQPQVEEFEIEFEEDLPAVTPRTTNSAVSTVPVKPAPVAVSSVHPTSTTSTSNIPMRIMQSNSYDDDFERQTDYSIEFDESVEARPVTTASSTGIPPASTSSSTTATSKPTKVSVSQTLQPPVTTFTQPDASNVGYSTTPLPPAQQYGSPMPPHQSFYPQYSIPPYYGAQQVASPYFQPQMQPPPSRLVLREMACQTESASGNTQGMLPGMLPQPYPQQAWGPHPGAPMGYSIPPFWSPPPMFAQQPMPAVFGIPPPIQVPAAFSVPQSAFASAASTTPSASASVAPPHSDLRQRLANALRNIEVWRDDLTYLHASHLLFFHRLHVDNSPRRLSSGPHRKRCYSDRCSSKLCQPELFVDCYFPRWTAGATFLNTNNLAQSRH